MIRKSVQRFSGKMRNQQADVPSLSRPLRS
jgi:hypothetical protein